MYTKFGEELLIMSNLDEKVEKLYQNAFRCKDAYFQVEELYSAYLNREYSKSLEYADYVLNGLNPIIKEVMEIRDRINELERDKKL